MPIIHFHIRWNSKGLDWESHPTRDEATESAKKLAGVGEAYSIETFTAENCPICNEIVKRTVCA